MSKDGNLNKERNEKFREGMKGIFKGNMTKGDGEMTNNKTWIEQIAEVANDKNRVDAERVTTKLKELAKEYGDSQGVRQDVKYSGDAWSVQLKTITVIFGIHELPFNLGDSLTDDKLKKVLQQFLVSIFVNK